MIKREIQKTIEKWLFRGKIIMLLGARQVGKTTLVKELLKNKGNPADYYNCELIQVSESLGTLDPHRLTGLFGKTKLVVLDEAHRVRNIGMVLKVFHDTYPDVQIVATGSSSFELADKVNEPLTGRAVDFKLYPLSLTELLQIHRPVDLGSAVEGYLRFGLYPEIVLSGEHEKKVLLDNLTSRYLYKDVLESENLRRSDIVVKLLQLIALQIGNEVSVNELALNLGINRRTVERYLDLLEKAFVIFRLHAFSRNIRSEIVKKVKIYFYDTGVRNSLIANYNALDIRNDTGQLWENFCVIERLKHNSYLQANKKLYFWRTKGQKEIDLIEDYEGRLKAFEFKWREQKFKIPDEFASAYNVRTAKVITKGNVLDLVKAL
jgi:predicted AAA+ superfamily ATPase